MTTTSTTIHDDTAGQAPVYPASVHCSFHTEYGSISIAPWTGPEGGYALWHRGEVVWQSADDKSTDHDIGILISQIDWLTECLGEGLEGEDAALLEQIRADHKARNPFPSPPTTEPQG